ncbi:hypothetical protein PHYPO_G00155180 [Pangasianodon hypophthalmus]|uniref:LITAF domain-containing protein n=1 Tax=Pangasianodon hypophthalmus TaxID=310915 RepID=A0A5N5JYC9_PANHP|nr:hypothetical protein PHYPO_G00155180 [Pangasianodon hypophthalmus]
MSAGLPAQPWKVYLSGTNTQRGSTQSAEVYQYQCILASNFVTTQHGLFQSAPPPVIIEQPPPPVIVQSAPAVAVVQPTGPLVMQAPMKSVPAATTCTFCQQQIVTMTRPVNGLLTWVIAGTLFFFCIWPFCVIPFFITSCKDIEHTCPNCKNVIYIYKPM